eukprot:TRINITY_DN33174_c0_g1_i1.p1 TRINITY_DN33174_c0_g1~~TRINITY_DN33174_c0_g1_i1.p1  ORF type:complete len:102 (-),score=13.14 TRINITY_DN33174_c0_g1_i1:255-560(-)
MGIYGEIRDAVAAKRAIRVVFKGHERDVCPHVIGHKNGHEKVLTYQFAGYSSSGLPPGGEWRCMFVSDISSVSVISAAWHTGVGHSRPQTCVDGVDLEVDF